MSELFASVKRVSSSIKKHILGSSNSPKNTNAPPIDSSSVANNQQIRRSSNGSIKSHDNNNDKTNSNRIKDAKYGSRAIVDLKTNGLIKGSYYVNKHDNKTNGIKNDDISTISDITEDQSVASTAPSTSSQILLKKCNSISLSNKGSTDFSTKSVTATAAATTTATATTPIHISAYNGDMDTIIQFLKQYPYEINKKYDFSDHITLLSSSSSSNSNENAKASPTPPLLPTLIRNALASAIDKKDLTYDEKWLIINGFNGSTLLHYACVADKIDIVKVLLANGVNVNVLNKASREADFYTTSGEIQILLWNYNHSNIVSTTVDTTAQPAGSPPPSSTNKNKTGKQEQRPSANDTTNNAAANVIDIATVNCTTNAVNRKSSLKKGESVRAIDSSTDVQQLQLLTADDVEEAWEKKIKGTYNTDNNNTSIQKNIKLPAGSTLKRVVDSLAPLHFPQHRDFTSAALPDRKNGNGMVYYTSDMASTIEQMVSSVPQNSKQTTSATTTTTTPAASGKDTPTTTTAIISTTVTIGGEAIVGKNSNGKGGSATSPARTDRHLQHTSSSSSSIQSASTYKKTVFKRITQRQLLSRDTIWLRVIKSLKEDTSLSAGRQDALQYGNQLLQKEFRGYASKDKWEGLSINFKSPATATATATSNSGRSRSKSRSSSISTYGGNSSDKRSKSAPTRSRNSSMVSLRR